MFQSLIFYETKALYLFDQQTTPNNIVKIISSEKNFTNLSDKKKANDGLYFPNMLENKFFQSLLIKPKNFF